MNAGSYLAGELRLKPTLRALEPSQLSIALNCFLVGWNLLHTLDAKLALRQLAMKLLSLLDRTARRTG